MFELSLVSAAVCASKLCPLFLSQTEKIRLSIITSVDLSVESPACQKINIAIFLDTINVVSVKVCMKVLHTG